MQIQALARWRLDEMVRAKRPRNDFHLAVSRNLPTRLVVYRPLSREERDEAGQVVPVAPVGSGPGMLRGCEGGAATRRQHDQQSRSNTTGETGATQVDVH
jgi:hypothetical protein